eukprot:TRINITY_DN168_c0_g2_i1.p1 TRINITY_DN168_c0_g2~~TRINITY_DN168_c0_g2_i1.p1  ORF type:complete len:722 (-),score=340.40 TRINITY_DN168_c0_g2_i1:365-2530(-)
MAQPQEAQRLPGVIKDGWLFWGNKMGDLIMWKKRWTALTLHKLCSFKSHVSLDEPVDTVLMATIEEMAFGKFLDQQFAFTVQIPADRDDGKISLACVTEEEREEWVKTLRNIVPKAKVELAKEILLRKTEKEASAKHAQQQIQSAIESIDRDSKRVAVYKGFKTYADDLAKQFQGLLKLVDQIPSIGQGVAKKDAFQECAYQISMLVDSANSTTAMCTNKGLIDEVVVRTGDIAVEMANILGYAIMPVHHANLPHSILSIRDQIQQVLDLLANAAARQQELDDAKALLNGGKKERERVDDFDFEGAVAGLTEKAKEAQDKMRDLQNVKDPKLVGEYSREAAALMCELMDATSFVAFQAGMDEDGEFLEASLGGLNEHTKQQLLAMMNAAKGFAAATTNVIDLLKQVPEGDTDDLLQVKLGASTRSADNALAAFMSVTGAFDMDPLPVWEPLNFDDPAFESSADVAETDAESELLDALRAIEESIAKLSLEVNEKQNEVQRANERSALGSAGVTIPDDGSISPQVMSAAKDMGQATASLVSAAAKAQKKLKEEEGGASYRPEDQNYTRGIVASAQSVAEATNFLMEIAMRADSSPEDVIAAARCANAANARLVAYARVKADEQSAAEIDAAAKEISKTTKRLVAAAKKQKAVTQERSVDEQIAAMKQLPATRQMTHKIEAQSKVAKLEVALDNARRDLFAMRRKVYARDNSVLKTKGGNIGL